MEGWVKISRKVLDWEWADVPEMFAFWIHLIMAANHEDKKWHGMVVPRGSFVTSVDALKSLTGLSPQQIRTALKRLVSNEQIEVKSTNKFTLITICKYVDYQDDGKDEQQTNNKQITNEQQTNNNKQELKKGKKEDISSDISKKEISKKPLDELDFVDEGLKEIFLKFLEMRRKIGKPLRTQTGIKARYSKLIRLSGGDVSLAVRIVTQSLDNEWQDFYELKDDTAPKARRTTTQAEYRNEDYW